MASGAEAASRGESPQPHIPPMQAGLDSASVSTEKEGSRKQKRSESQDDPEAAAKRARIKAYRKAERMLEKMQREEKAQYESAMQKAREKAQERADERDRKHREAVQAQMDATVTIKRASTSVSLSPPPVNGPDTPLLPRTDSMPPQFQGRTQSRTPPPRRSGSDTRLPSRNASTSVPPVPDDSEEAAC
eukprot:TRINITY_DN1961_c2_g1_i1.p1 TRINITY_DN1961_c2_g1~~TRINITY_DN1961_c2_g1_i1.p1  ORF type:complete len:210 (+),score=60.84 TRINITY_DN1961_c2_g1_i1:64-630(+)